MPLGHISNTSAEGKAILTLVTTVTKAEQLAAVVVLGAAPDAPTVFPEHPHVEVRIAVVFEVEGASPAQAARAGKRLPAAGQGCVARDRDLDRDP